MPARCANAASVRVAWPHSFILSSCTPRKCTKSASVSGDGGPIIRAAHVGCHRRGERRAPPAGPSNARLDVMPRMRTHGVAQLAARPAQRRRRACVVAQETKHRHAKVRVREQAHKVQRAQPGSVAGGSRCRHDGTQGALAESGRGGGARRAHPGVVPKHASNAASGDESTRVKVEGARRAPTRTRSSGDAPATRRQYTHTGLPRRAHEMLQPVHTVAAATGGASARRPKTAGSRACRAHGRPPARCTNTQQRTSDVAPLAGVDCKVGAAQARQQMHERGTGEAVAHAQRADARQARERCQRDARRVAITDV